MAAAGKGNHFPVPGQRNPREFPTQEDDMPLRGPWSSPSEREDVEPDSPLPGPWDAGARNEQRSDPQDGIGDQPKDISPSKRDNDIKGERRWKQELMSTATPKRRGKRVNPLHSLLADRNTLGASVVFGEVISKRGGRQARSGPVKKSKNIAKSQDCHSECSEESEYLCGF